MLQCSTRKLKFRSKVIKYSVQFTYRQTFGIWYTMARSIDNKIKFIMEWKVSRNKFEIGNIFWGSTAISVSLLFRLEGIVHFSFIFRLRPVRTMLFPFLLIYLLVKEEILGEGEKLLRNLNSVKKYILESIKLSFMWFHLVGRCFIWVGRRSSKKEKLKGGRPGEPKEFEIT